MRGNRKRDTRPELALRAVLHRRGLRYRLRYAVVTSGVRVVPDVVFPRHQVAVFVDGCWWHRCPEHANIPRTNAAYWLPKLTRNVERDELVTSSLAGAGWTVIRVWEHEVVRDASAVTERIAEALTAG